MVTYLLEEAGEVTSTVRGLEGYKPLEKVENRANAATKLSDMLYAIFVLAEHCNLNLEEIFLKTFKTTN
jgi:NTP pyrophosphatase (non-canonical NTP hydrolase)